MNPPDRVLKHMLNMISLEHIFKYNKGILEQTNWGQNGKEN